MHYITSRAGLMLAGALFIANSAVADTLSKGNIAQFSFDGTAGNSYEIGFNAQTTCPSSASKSCCVLLVNNGTTQPSSGAFELAVAASDTSVASVVVDKASDGKISAAVYALESCQFTPPSIINIRTTSDTLQFGSGNGQLGESYTAVPTTQTNVSGGYMLRDISRRASMEGVNDNPNVGQMNDTSAITARRVFGYWEANDLFLTDNPKDSDGIYNTSGQSELLDALINSGKVYDYWQTVLGFNSFDNNSATMDALTNAPFPPEPATFCGEVIPAGSLYNAFWNGFEIVFTPRDFTSTRSGTYYANSLAAALDVTAHEWGHAISDRAVNLTYARESGALNEAYSDWMGVAVELANGENNWTMGEGVALIRDLADPSRFGDPDTYRGANWQPTDTVSCTTPDICVNDYCGVHTNSGVANKMFYLLAAGGSHNGVEVEGIGADMALQIATDALHNYWTSNVDFAGAKAGMISAAANYGDNAVEQTRKAWEAVGVSEAREDCDGGTIFGKSCGTSSGGGGCTLGNPNGEVDPTLYLLLLLALVALARRRFA